MQTMITMKPFVLLLKIEYGGPETILAKELLSESLFGGVMPVSLDSETRAGAIAATSSGSMIVVEMVVDIVERLDSC
jgi:hypothetical protein